MSNTVKIENNRPRIYTAEGVSLVPGLNTVDADKAAKFLANPSIKIKVDRGFITLKSGKVGKVTAQTKDTDTETAAATAAAAAKAQADAEQAALAKAQADAEKAAAAKAKADAEQAEAEKNAENAAADEDAAKFAELPYSISGLNAEDSIAKIKVIEDQEYLMHIAKTEERKTVVEAAKNRVVDLQPAD